MPRCVVVEAQWGDEGEGEVADYLGSRMDAVARFQGGNNAGHIVVVQDRHIGQNRQVVLHLLPSGVPQKASYIIGPRIVVDPFVLLGEINQLEEHGLNADRALLSNCSRITIPYHMRLDTLIEASLKNHKIGTTKRGIDSCYTDRYSRQGLRIGDLQDFESSKEKLKLAVDMKNITFQKVYENPGLSYKELVTQFVQVRRALLPRITNAQIIINQALDARKQVLFEGAQTAMLDINCGNYPYVTGSSPTSTDACTGVGISSEELDVIIGIAKVYSTRTGGGPFVSELSDDMGA